MKIRTLEELEIELEIDEGNLEEEETKQSQLFYEASKGYALAFEKADTAKMITEQLVANLSMECKNNSLEKTTVKDIDNYVNSNANYLMQKQAQIKLEKEEQEWKGLMKAYESRGNRLRDLVNLTAMGYYNSGLITRDALKDKFSEAYKNRKGEDEESEA